MASDDVETGRNDNFSVLINTLPPDKRSQVRYLERLNKKIANCSYSVKFNKTCIMENLMPKFTNIYIYNLKISDENSM